MNEDDWLDRERPVIPTGIPCPVCDQELIMEPLYDETTVVVAYVCPTHGVARIADPFS